MRTVKIVIITLFAVALTEFLAVEIFLRTHQFSAKDQPSWLERALAEHARSISVPGDAKTLKNPRPVTEGIMAEAREHWTEHCSVCHGLDGRGETVVGRGMYPPAPNMIDANTQQKTDGEIFYIISNGVRLTGMPAWEGADSPEAIWDLVAFIRHMPELTPEELKLMGETMGEESAEDKGNAPGGEQEPTGPSNARKQKGDKHGAKPHQHKHEH